MILLSGQSKTIQLLLQQQRAAEPSKMDRMTRALQHWLLSQRTMGDKVLARELRTVIVTCRGRWTPPKLWCQCRDWWCYTHTHQEYEKDYYLFNWGLWGEQGRPLKQVQNGLREQGKKTGLGFYLFIYLFIYFWLCWVFGSCEGFL